ncbi:MULTISPECIES: efflux RND transporter permease subunit [Robiginitalea]|uniref:Putative metal resistance related trasport membrane protein n=1 Tax=Robiginitalea biformata (strain ATCC BAA-864 / DSM 15991 / KCTC 12146 / HTCC2501) TaxID=313596 RepID=A4CP12_ROBBH|nr:MULTISPECIES: efflux RND transporter permease subunit [Robiginitalea]EAR14629.1 putative metal resistance related trasport membrane protein [Robiginitalea biformata HTCC2501]MDC6354890.1 efflux RND transporter permease subunit [Robiginitalea sp. PM2]MDC6375156.1 efflux RND transporter permease subunit [Robiginitalea sp. SP8]
MLNKILTLSLHNRLVVLLGAALLSAAGIYLARTMNVDVFPDLTAPTVTILTEAHGMESEEVEKLVTYQLETAMNGSPNVRRIRSSSASGISIVWVEFEWGTDIYRARQIVSERIPVVQESLPEGVGTPTMAPISSIMGEIMLLGVRSDSLSPMELRTLSDWVIRPRIKSIGGIANVIVIGGDYKQYQVLANPEKLKYYNVGLQELLQKVAESNRNAPGGILNQHGNQYLIKGSGRAHSPDQIREATLKQVNGQTVKVGDVATVQIGAADKIGDGSLNASPAVILTLSKQPEVNTLELTDRLDAAISDLQRTLPGVEIKNHIFRQANFIDASIDNLNRTLLEGAFFVVLVLFIFLMNWRTTVISLVAIPISLLVSIIVLKLLGYTINTMSLGGMAIAIGALVDDAIIDVENVFKRLRENIRRPKGERLPVLTVVKDASIEIRSSIIIATLIIIVSFIPLFFLSGMEGRLLRPLGIAFITSVLTSLLVAVTVTPVLCSYLLRREDVLTKQAGGTRVERWLQEHYTRLLDRVLKVPKMAIGITAGIFLLSLALITQLGRSFLPEFNEGSLVISAVGVPGMSLEESNKNGELIERLLLEMPEVEVVTRRTGRAELDEHAQGVNAAEIDVPFTLDGKTKEAFFEEVRTKLSVVPGVNITLGQPIAHRIDHMLSGTRANIAIKIFGDDLQRLFELGKEIESAIGSVDGIADVAVDQQIEVPQLRITPRRQLLAAYGMTVGDLMEQVDVAFAGEKAGEIYEGQRYFDLVVRFEKRWRNQIQAIESALISLPGGGQAPLDQLAEIRSVSSPNTISREEVQRKIVVAANVQGRDLRGVVNDIEKIIEGSIDLPEGYRIDYGGQFESEAKASRLLLITAILAILVIFLLLYFEFRDVKLSFIVLINLPLALIGGILIVYFTSGIISIAATIGFISLFGIATRNGILLVSRYEDLRKVGMDGTKLLKTGALDRLNPILMTAFTTGLALIPLALKGGEPGNEIQSPMAVVILGGLLSATVLNLVIIPCVYKLVNAK